MPTELHPTYPIATERLLLRPLALQDVDNLFAYRSREDVCRYVPFFPMDRATIAARIERSGTRGEIRAAGENLWLGVELARESRIVGDLLLMFHSAEHRGGEIGWVLNPADSGHGYATEAARAMLHLAFDELGLHRMVARVDARNGASLRLAERLGMRREAHLVRNEWFKGEWTDEIDFALLDEEWPSPAAHD